MQSALKGFCFMKYYVRSVCTSKTVYKCVSHISGKFCNVWTLGKWKNKICPAILGQACKISLYAKCNFAERKSCLCSLKILQSFTSVFFFSINISILSFEMFCKIDFIYNYFIFKVLSFTAKNKTLRRCKYEYFSVY